MERESRFPRWMRRKSRSAARADAAAKAREDLLLATAREGFPLAPAAHPQDYGCSCNRIGCPTPGRHPLSFAWQSQATTDPDQVLRWLRADPEANFVTPTGHVHDVLDVPLEAGTAALERLAAQGAEIGPVAVADPDRMLFFTKTRNPADDDDEWWPCELDCHPETMDEHPGLRWHCRASYVLVPPSAVPADGGVRWLRGPEWPLPEPLTLLEALTDACAAHAGDDETVNEEAGAWPG
ncbi:bifunctional DNA primase/polymerase [Streptomyces sp. YIM 98790]|uniref:bifunctional DNA primase/polymerase n=1 Tax=Streptomyces sp. YIM 98790 TaxID=2689077 RepID=UPI00140AC482|nr:bifunctional DNA primase/polymerase [Streptomyces sp. YIM 98790]